MFGSNFYKKQPVLIQNALVSIRGLTRKMLRDGYRMMEVYDLISQNEYCTKKSSRYLAEKLYVAISSAKKNVPYYASVDIGRGASVNAVSQFPLISKQDVLNNPLAFRSSAHRGLVVAGSTSGTTGSPIFIPQTFESVLLENAFVYRQLVWAGFEPGDRRIWLRGDMVVPFNQKKPPFWRYSVFEGMLLMSSYHLNRTNIAHYIKRMADFKPDIIQAHPSSILLIAQYLKSKNQYFPSRIKSIVTSSESIGLEDKMLLEEVFQCRVFDWYGLFERVAAIGTCEHGRYHEISDYSFVEYLPQADDAYEIIGTNINNSLYPLIRYRTGDIVKKSSKSCPCGRSFPVIDSIQGRIGDYLIGEDGQPVTILSHIVKDVRGLLAAQFLQEDMEKIHVLAVVDQQHFNGSSVEKLVNNIHDRLGQTMRVSVEYVDAIPSSKNGKRRLAICTIPVNR